MTRRGLLAGAAGGLAALLAACGPAAAGDAPAQPGTGRDDSPAGEARLGLGSITGRLLYVGDANVWTWERGSAKKLTDDRISRQPQWSPDGKKIALVKLAPSSSEIWIMDADSANSRQLTRNTNPVLTNNNWAYRPVWWPDGSRLLYLSEEMTNDLMLWQLSLDGKTHRPFLSVPDMEGGLDMPSIAADGKRLAAVSYRGPGLRSNVWTYGLPGGPWRQLTEAAEGAYDPAISPDGTRIAYTQRTKGKHDVWVMGVDGAGPQQVTQDGASRAPCWSPEGQFLAYCSAQSGSFELWVTAVPAADTPAPLAGTAGGALASGTGGASNPSAQSTPEPRPGRRSGATRQLTRGAQVDATSGISWTR